MSQGSEVSTPMLTGWAPRLWRAQSRARCLGHHGRSRSRLTGFAQLLPRDHGSALILNGVQQDHHAVAVFHLVLEDAGEVLEVPVLDDHFITGAERFSDPGQTIL